MSGEEVDSDEFEYRGELVFNGVYKTEVNSDRGEEKTEELRERLENRLQPRFERGNPGSPNKGYLSLDLEGYAEGSDEVGGDLGQVSRGLINQRFIKERFESGEEVVDSDGNPVESGDGEYIRVPYETYMFWDIPDYMFLKGSERTVKKTAPEISTALGSEVRQEALSFEYDFLLWLLYKYHRDENLPGADLDIHRLTAAKAEGSRDTFGAANQVDGSLNLIRSTSFIEAVLQEKMPTMIEGVFHVDGHEVRAKIHSGPENDPKNVGGKLWVLAQEDLSSADDLRRTLISLKFLREMSELYTEWENMDKTDQYVPPTFFTELRNIGREEGVDINFALDELIKEYLNKRDEDWGDYDF